MKRHPLRLPLPEVTLVGDLTLPPRASGLVIFAHGSGSSRFSPRNKAVAAVLQTGHLATLLFDLLTPEEESVDATTGDLRFDIDFLADRLTAVVDQCRRDRRMASLPIGLFGASTGAAAALVTAAQRPEAIGAVVSRGGRPDLAAADLPRVAAPTLLIVGSLDEPVLSMNRLAADLLQGAPCDLRVITGATHLFEEPGTLDRVAQLARDWFEKWLAGSRRREPQARA